MKKTLVCLALLVGLSGQVWGQQLPNVGFDSWKGSGNAGSTYQSSDGSMNGGNSNLGLRKRPGDEPTNWFGSSINQKVFMEKAQELIYKKTSNGNTYAQLKNSFVGVLSIGSNAPAYLTFGTPWVYAVSNVSNCDGGTYGGMTSFTWKPDAIRGRYKKTAASEAEPSYIVAYIWNGTFTSQITSSSTKDADRLKDDVDRAILGSVSATGVTAPSRVTQSGKLIAWCNYAFKNSTTSDSNWETIEVPLNYVDANISETPSKMNVVICAGDYWTRDNIQDGTTLDVDDVDFVYFSQLNSLTIDGTSVPNFDKDVYEYTVNSYYKEGVTSIVVMDNTKAGVATINTNQADGFGYNAENAQYKIKVTNQPGTESHTYTIQFKQYEANLTAATYNNADVNFTNGAPSVDQFYDENKLALTVSEQASVSTIFDQATQKLTITVTSGDGKKTNTYTIQFKQYTYAMTSVTYNGTTVTADNGIYQVNEYYDKYDADKLVPVGSDEAVTFEKGEMNATTHQLTVTAKSGNYANDGKSTTYTFQFKDYFATLEATYDGTAISFDKNNSATVNAFYEADKLSLEPSDAATTALSMDEQTQLLTITVTSGDGKKVVPYTIQFNQYEAEIVSATYNGTPVTFTNNAATVNERYVESNLTLVLSDGATSTLSHNSTTQLLTITVTSKNNAKTNTYTIQFPTSFTYTIKGGEGHWGTFCFPGKVTSAEGIEVYSILGKDKETDPSWISLTQVTKFPLTDGMPYIYLSTTSDETIQVITDASYAPNPRTSNGLVGVYKDTKMETTLTSVPYILTGNKIQKAGTGVWCRANHAWIRMSGKNVVPVYDNTNSTTGNVKYFYIANDLPTDIESIENEAQQPKQVFDLSGRRVTNPTKGGIYIVNGKKIVIR